MARAEPVFAEYDFLFREAAVRVAERVADVRREFPQALIVGDRQALLAAALQEGGKVGEMSVAAVEGDIEQVAGDVLVPLAVTALGLQWVNDLPGVLAQLSARLKPDGLLVGCLLGGETLHELRQVLMQAEQEVSGGASLRVCPMVEVRSLGGLLQRAGLAMPMADVERVTVTYAHIVQLMHDLRFMGMSNMMTSPPRPLTRALIARAQEIYEERFTQDGKLRATFDLVMFTGWKPDASQPKPAKRDSGQVNLRDALS